MDDLKEMSLEQIKAEIIAIGEDQLKLREDFNRIKTRRKENRRRMEEIGLELDRRGVAW